jgi:tetratricopeptide (TPR) repeat protein
MVIFEEAWRIYPPAPLPALGVRITQAEEGTETRGAERALREYIESELEPKMTAINVQIRSNPTATLYNQLGNLYTRTNRMTEAKAAFERAAGMGSVSAMVNRGNIALLEKDSTTAERWFAQALAAQPENASARRGLEQTMAYRSNE